MHAKAIPDSGFSGDDGSAAPGVVAALAAYCAGKADQADLVAALTGSRLLVPVTAVLSDPASADEHQSAGSAGPARRREKQSEIALITIMAPDGRRALPAFTSVGALVGWNARARPVPAPAARVCAGALAEGADLVVVDPGGPSTVELSGPTLWALAEGRQLVPAAEDPEVIKAVRRATAGMGSVFDTTYVSAGAEPQTELVISLLATDAAGQSELRSAAERVARRLAADPIMRVRVEHGVQIAVVTAPPPNGHSIQD